MSEAEETLVKLFTGLARSGMSFGDCAECGRPYGSRIATDLCMICRGEVPDDGWKRAHPETDRNVQRVRLLSVLRRKWIDDSSWWAFYSDLEIVRAR
jgi:hypothetical protein